MTLNVSDASEVAASDELLIAQVREGSQEAYAELYERHIGSATATANSYARNSSDVADLVAEAFANVLQVIQAGKGPTVFFRAYLLTTLRRLAALKSAADAKQVAVEDLEGVMQVTPHNDPAIVAFEKDVIGRSFKDLPERWQAVLWHTEVDGMTPAEISPLLGIKPNAVAALAVRAREGLKQAYLQNHISTADEDCAEFSKHLGAYARGGLARLRKARVEAHLLECRNCRTMLCHVRDVGFGMRSIIFPATAGIAFGGQEAGKVSGFGFGAVAATGTHSAGMGAVGVGAVLTASVAGIGLVGAMVAAAVGLPIFGALHQDSTASPTYDPVMVQATLSPRSPLSSAAPSGSPIRPSLTPSAQAVDALPELVITMQDPRAVESPVLSPVPPASLVKLSVEPSASPGAEPEPSQLPAIPVETAVPTLTPTVTASASATAEPSSSPVPSVTPSPSAEPTPSPSLTPTPTPSVSLTPTPTPTPTATAKPMAEFSASGRVLSQSELETTLQLDIVSSEAGLDAPQVSFVIPRLWMGLPVRVTAPPGWSCTATSTLFVAGSNCAAPFWADATGTFILTVPTPTILEGYPVEVGVSAVGARKFSAWLSFG